MSKKEIPEAVRQYMSEISQQRKTKSGGRKPVLTDEKSIKTREYMREYMKRYRAKQREQNDE